MKFDKELNLGRVNTDAYGDTNGGRKSTLQKFSKDVFIQHLEIIDYNESTDKKHVEYIIKVKGRTKYLVNLKDLAELGLIES
jgi:hypothetical protein